MLGTERACCAVRLPASTPPCPRPGRGTTRYRAVVYDINGREADEAALVLDAVGPVEQYIFCSSAGVYKKSDQMPHREEDEVDFNSRHKVRPLAQHKAAAAAERSSGSAASV